MKKLNLFLSATLVAMVSFFSACSNDDPTAVSITLDATSVNSGAAITGKITALGGLESVTLLKDGQTVTGWPVKDFSSKSQIVGSAIAGYTVRIEGLADGSYTLRAVDKKAVEDNETFTVGTALTKLASATKIYCTLADGSTQSTCASADGTTYAAKDATAAEQAKVDFVYFNASGTSLGIYSPSSVPSALNTTFANWTTKNTTHFAKTTTISFESATYTFDVIAAANAATETSVTGLEAGNVVVFKTEAGKVGV
ncbi:MAG TPA: hypothetical protein VK152_00635, partial [Paludibacter sp.]|nr:hypothetical protein [Paludibacter sp.]